MSQRASSRQLASRVRQDAVTGERNAYRRALDAILKVKDEPDSFAIAHAAITPYTDWKAASDATEARVAKAVNTSGCCPRCGAKAHAQHFSWCEEPK